MTAAHDDYSHAAHDLSGPAEHAAVVTPSDTVDLVDVSRALIVGTTGDLKVTMNGGETVVLPSVPAGVLPLRVKRVWNTGTTATHISAIW